MLASLSLRSLDRDLDRVGELVVASASTSATFVGAFDRKPRSSSDDVFRRGSGGPPLLVSPGSLWVNLCLARPDSLSDADPSRIVNRYVRPLLRALTRRSPARYLGRDCITSRDAAIAWVGFAHEASTQRTTFEALIACRSRFSPPRASFLGKRPGTLEDVWGRTVEPAEIASAIQDAYRAAYGADMVGECPPIPPATPLVDEPPWPHAIEEAIGLVCAGADAQGRLRIGGEFLASRDAVAETERRVHDAPPRDMAELGSIIEAIWSSPRIALEGVRSRNSFAIVLGQALGM